MGQDLTDTVTCSSRDHLGRGRTAVVGVNDRGLFGTGLAAVDLCPTDGDSGRKGFKVAAACQDVHVPDVVDLGSRKEDVPEASVDSKRSTGNTPALYEPLVSDPELCPVDLVFDLDVGGKGGRVGRSRRRRCRQQVSCAASERNRSILVPDEEEATRFCFLRGLYGDVEPR